MNPFDEGGMIDQMFGATLPEVYAKPVVDSLMLRNRAYQVMYALGDTFPRTLTDGEAACLVGIVQQLTQEPITMLDRVLLSTMSRGMIAYVSGEPYKPVPDAVVFGAINGPDAPVPTGDAG